MLSVIVATKNEARNISRCLESIIRNSSHDEVEIIVVDNASTDLTREICKNYPVKLYQLADFVELSKIQNPRGEQLNIGVKKASGDIIFFPDADMTFENGLLDEIQKKGKLFDGLYIPEVIIGNSYFGRIRDYERSFYNMTPIDGIRVVKKKIFEIAGGFDAVTISFGPDDWDFTKRIKARGAILSITELSLYHHEKDLNLWSYLAKKAQYTSSFNGYLLKWGSNDEDIRRQFGFSYRFCVVFLESGKWRKIINQPILFISVILLKICVGIIFLCKKIS
jgi:glycosyltransferase involved in cell wall biosynthesis